MIPCLCRSLLNLIVFGLVIGQAACVWGATFREPWDSVYRGAGATGRHVVALWSFDGPDPSADVSGNGHAAVLQAARIVPEGRFGGALRCFPGWPVEDKRHRALVKNHPDLSPSGAFTLEMWLNPDPAFKGYGEAFLIDKKYVAHTDYQLILKAEDRSGKRRLQAALGFGGRSVSWYSEALEFKVGRWYHVAFAYDGKGTGRFFVNGRLCGEKQVEGLLGIQPGGHPLSIGDRLGSYYHGFPGRIDQVRICRGALEFRVGRIERVSDRRAFLRFEKQASLRFMVRNLTRGVWRKATLSWHLEGTADRKEILSDLKGGKARELSYLVDTRLRPDEYPLTCRLEIAGRKQEAISCSFSFTIVPRRPPDQMPVVMWGAGLREIERLKKIGFTYALGIGADYGKIWSAGKPVSAASAEKVAETRRALDRALVSGVTFAASLSPGSYLRNRKEFLRVGRDGNPYKGRADICGLFPEIADFCYNVGASVAQTYGDLPAFGAALLHTEVRDAARPCFHPHDFAAFRRDCGIDIPRAVVSRWGVDYHRLNGFPPNRVVPDDDPIYVYYRWYWKKGDGWNGLTAALLRGLKTMGREDFWTWHDPAVRTASVYGSGNGVEVISQWTYSYPDPIRIAVATEELLAMARGGPPGRKVMKMTQIIWYRSQTAPKPQPSGPRPAWRARWEREEPDARFITIAPIHLREAFWTKIARPIKGIMYHGWQSVVPTDSPSSYRYTHPETQHELRRLIDTVVRPLGPVLLHVEGIQSDVAYYESFAAQVFAGRGTYGWSGKWLGDGYQVAMWSGLQPEIIYDETITGRGLKRYKILFMLDCDVVTESVLAAVKRFRKRGGIIIGDNRLTPAIDPDIRLPVYKRKGKAAEDKAALLQIASQLRRELEGRYERYVDSSNPEVIPYRRRYAESDYIFLVNDHREYGRYVGHHGLVMENGLPSRATVTVARPEGVVYDLVSGRRVEVRRSGGRLSLDVELGPGEGRLFLVTPKPIDRVVIDAPGEVSAGESVRVTVTVLGKDGLPVEAVIPLRVDIEDSECRQAEFSGWWAAVRGRVEIKLDIAPNDPAGLWRISASELASGRKAAHFFRVRKT